MNSRKFLIVIVPGLALILLLSLGNVLASAPQNAPAAPDEASIEIAKVPPEQAVLFGQSVTFTIFITNTGNVDLDLAVQDPLGDPDCVAPPVNPLPAGEATSYTCTTQDVTADFTNSITVTGTYTDDASIEASASAFVQAVDAAVDVTLSPLSQTVPLNSTASYSVTVKNEGAVDLSLAADALYGNDDCESPPPFLLRPNRTTTYTCTVSNVTADFTNVITVTGSYTSVFGSVAVNDFAEAFVNATPVITVTKTADPVTVPEPGGLVTYTVAISNPGGSNVVLVELMDDKFGNLRESPEPTDPVSETDCPDLINIGPNSEAQCFFVAEVNGQPGLHTNTITATVEEDGTEAPASDSDSATVTIQDEPSSLATTITAVPDNVPEPGGDVNFTVRVENTSATDAVEITSLNGDSPLNDLNGKGNCKVPKALGVGAAFQCTLTVMIEGNSGDEKNFTVIASGTDDDGADITDSSPPVKITISDPDIKHVFLPFIVNNFVADEPNDTCNDAYPLTVNTDHRFLPDDVNDWYRFSLSGPGNVVVALTNFVPVNDQIVVYGGGCGTLSVLKNNGNFSTTKIVDLGTRPAGTYHIRVITKDGQFSTEPYTLRVNVQ